MRSGSSSGEARAGRRAGGHCSEKAVSACFLPLAWEKKVQPGLTVGTEIRLYPILHLAAFTEVALLRLHPQSLLVWGGMQTLRLAPSSPEDPAVQPALGTPLEVTSRLHLTSTACLGTEGSAGNGTEEARF